MTTKVMWDCPVKGCMLHILTPGGLPVEHKCPYPLGETRISWMAYGPSLLQQLWDEMDRTTEQLMNPAVMVEVQLPGTSEITSMSNEVAKGRARGIAHALSLFMMPHFTTEDAVVREAVKRYKMKKAGEEYETPGLGSRTYEPPPGDAKLATAPARRQPTHNLDADQIAKIKMKADGGWDTETLAMAYAVSEAVIKSILQS